DILPLCARRLGPPYLGIKELEQHLVDTLVRQKGLNQRSAKIDRLTAISAALCTRYHGRLVRAPCRSAASPTPRRALLGHRSLSEKTLKRLRGAPRDVTGLLRPTSPLLGPGNQSVAGRASQWPSIPTSAAVRRLPMTP